MLLVTKIIKYKYFDIIKKPPCKVSCEMEGDPRNVMTALPEVGTGRSLFWEIVKGWRAISDINVLIWEADIELSSTNTRTVLSPTQRAGHVNCIETRRKHSDKKGLKVYGCEIQDLQFIMIMIKSISDETNLSRSRPPINPRPACDGDYYN